MILYVSIACCFCARLGTHSPYENNHSISCNHWLNWHFAAGSLLKVGYERLFVSSSFYRLARIEEPLLFPNKVLKLHEADHLALVSSSQKDQKGYMMRLVAKFATLHALQCHIYRIDVILLRTIRIQDSWVPVVLAHLLPVNNWNHYRKTVQFARWRKCHFWHVS